MSVIRSRENARVKGWARLASEAKERRASGRALIEGVHLVEACLAAGNLPSNVIVSESGLARPEVSGLLARIPLEPVVLADAVFRRIADTESPVGIAAEIGISPARIDLATSPGCVFLEAIQDAGNVGAILRSAAAFGIQDAVCGQGCADPWSPKALRAAMGGHFLLRIGASDDLAADVRRFGAQTVSTDAHAGQQLHAIDLTGRTGWILGSEGAGVSPALAAAATLRATIAAPGKVESLNVAAAAAICFYERQAQLSRRGARG